MLWHISNNLFLINCNIIGWYSWLRRQSRLIILNWSYIGVFLEADVTLINSFIVSLATLLTSPLGGMFPRKGVVVGNDKMVEYIEINTWSNWFVKNNVKFRLVKLHGSSISVRMSSDSLTSGFWYSEDWLTFPWYPCCCSWNWCCNGNSVWCWGASKGVFKVWSTGVKGLELPPKLLFGGTKSNLFNLSSKFKFLFIIVCRDYELGNYENVYQDKIIRTKAMLIQFAETC